MLRYYFSLKNGRLYNDTDGLELPDIEAARTEAVGFARDLMRLEPERRDWSGWVVCVTDEAQNSVLKVLFSEVD
jgi:uncharacterized protein DUF6894